MRLLSLASSLRAAGHGPRATGYRLASVVIDSPLSELLPCAVQVSPSLSPLLLPPWPVSSPTAQHQLQPVAALRGTPAVELALRKLETVGTLMMTTAAPRR
jgi:hypothetical protein